MKRKATGTATLRHIIAQESVEAVQTYYQCMNCNEYVGLSKSAGTRSYDYGDFKDTSKVRCPWCGGNMEKVAERHSDGKGIIPPERSLT